MLKEFWKFKSKLKLPSISTFLSWIKRQVRRSEKLNQKKHLDTNLCLEYKDRIFYIVFTESQHMFSRFLKPGYSHCYAIEQQEHVYLVYDPTRNGLSVYMPPCNSEHPLVENMMILANNLNVLKIVVRVVDDSVIMRPKPISCVTIIENILGINVGWLNTLTPYRFYNALQNKSHPNIMEVKKLCQLQESRQSKQEDKQR